MTCDVSQHLSLIDDGSYASNRSDVSSELSHVGEEVVSEDAEPWRWLPDRGRTKDQPFGGAPQL